MKYWLFKSDLADYPLEKFMKDKVTPWEGVRNYQARNFMMKEMSVGDKGIFYISNANPSAAQATLEVISEPHADSLAFNKKSDYYDEKSTPESPRWFCVDVRYVSSFKRSISLDDMRKEKKLAKMRLLQRGNRLSITPLTQEEYELIVKLGNA